MECALCKSNTELKNSHILPKFLFKSLKKASPNGKIHSVKNPRNNIQDGAKRELLCGECEGLFNKNETKFANEIFHKYNAGTLEKIEHDSWLIQFITSINWRNLYLDIESYSTSNKINARQLGILKNAETLLRGYLKGERDNLEKIENHLFIVDSINQVSGEFNNDVLHKIIKSSAFGNTLINDNFDSYYIFSNLRGIIAVTIIKPAAEEIWNNTLVEAVGEFDPSRIPSINSPVLTELHYFADRQRMTTDSIMEMQSERIFREAMKKFKQQQVDKQ